MTGGIRMHASVGVSDRANRRAGLIARLEAMLQRNASLLDRAELAVRDASIVPRFEMIEESEARELEQIVDELGRLDGTWLAQSASQ